MKETNIYKTSVLKKGRALPKWGKKKRPMGCRLHMFGLDYHGLVYCLCHSEICENENGMRRETLFTECTHVINCSV
jgi:hypothetical protein